MDKVTLEDMRAIWYALYEWQEKTPWVESLTDTHQEQWDRLCEAMVHIHELTGIKYEDI